MRPPAWYTGLPAMRHMVRIRSRVPPRRGQHLVTEFGKIERLESEHGARSLKEHQRLSPA